MKQKAKQNKTNKRDNHMKNKNDSFNKNIIPDSGKNKIWKPCVIMSFLFLFKCQRRAAPYHV